MKYWIYLAWQYMMRHKSRTLYSIFGIIITFVMCFAVLTTGYSIWDYGFQLSGGEESQMHADVYNINEEGEELGVTEEMIAQIRVLEQCEEVERLWVYDESWQYFPLSSQEEADQTEEEYEKENYLCKTNDLETGHVYNVGIQLKDLSDLQKSAASLQEQCGLVITPDSEVEMYLGQGEDASIKYLFQSIEAILASVTALFCIMILRNTMMISVVERMKDYGIYRCVGMSRKQLYQVLAVEGLFMSLVAVVFGVGIGYGLLQALTPWLNHTLNLELPFCFGFYYQAVLWTALLCIGVTLFALIEPSRQTGQLSPMEAIHNNIVLRNRKGKRRENLTYQPGGIWGRFLGASGEYAYKNMRRNRGRFSGLFVSLLVCMTVLGMMESVSESLYATVENIYQGKNKKYMEWVAPNTKYDDALADRIHQDIVEIEKVEDTGVAMRTSDLSWAVDPVLAEYVDNTELGLVQQDAYEREDIEYLKPYLIEGSIDYDVMVQNHGVLLCDMKYNEESIETDFNQEDVRMTGYHVGDRIGRLNTRGIKMLRQIYYGALDQIAEKNGIPKQDTDAGSSPYIDLEYCSEEEEGFEQYKKEFLQIIQKQGIHLDSQKVKECSNIWYFWDLLGRWMFERKDHAEYVTEYVIQGIISEDTVFGDSFPYSAIAFVQTIDTVKQDFEVDNSSDLLLHPDTWSWMVTVRRDPSVMQDEALQRYCEDQAGYTMYYSNIFEDGAGGEYGIQDYLDMLHTMGIVRVISTLFIICIGIICMIQIYNTLCANIATRRKELQLYRLVGMGGRQMRRMLLLEHVAATVFAVITGYFLAWAASWYFIEYLLNENGNVLYTWSGPVVAVMGAGIVLLTCLVCLCGIHSIRKLQ
ncbi:MAG: ABC transporter permease [Lachnospiraceae bacterium]|nr:ABC transporter permease [Lachnospiraceae bacterium]